MERSQNWPDLRSPLTKLWDIPFNIYYYLYQSLRDSRQSFSRCSYDKHSNFLWSEVTWSDLVTWTWVTWVWNFHNICRKIMNRCAKNGGATRRRFLNFVQTSWKAIIRHILTLYCWRPTMWHHYGLNLAPQRLVDYLAHAQTCTVTNQRGWIQYVCTYMHTPLFRLRGRIKLLPIFKQCYENCVAYRVQIAEEDVGRPAVSIQTI